MRRGLIAIALGLSLLILMTWLGTIISNIVPHRPTAQIQNAQAGPYLITLQVAPNPPPISSPATLDLQIVLQATQEPISNAQVLLQSSMETMDMGTAQDPAAAQGSGHYRAHVQFAMSGPWQVHVLISRPGTPSASTNFEITAQ